MKQAVLRHQDANTVIQQLNLLQFISVAVMGMTTPFFSVYLVDAGLSPTLIGTLLSVGAFLELILTPTLNTLADRFNIHRRLLIAYMVMFGAANVIYASTNVVWIVAIGVLLIESSLRPSGTLAMQLTMTRINEIRQDAVGRIRSFAPLGYSLASLTAMPLFSMGGYKLVFWAGVLLSAITIQVTNVLPANTASKNLTSKPPKRRRGFYVLALSQFFTTLGIRAGFAFWLVYVCRDLGLSTAKIGLFMAFVAGMEIPFFMLLDPIMKRYNPRIIYIIGSLGMGAFFAVVGFVPNLFWLIILNVVRGMIWPMYNLPIFLVTAQISHPRNVATNQAIMNVTMPSIAMLLFGSVAGWIFDHQAAWVFFLACATACTIGGLIAIVGYRFLAPTTLVEQRTAELAVAVQA